MCTMSIFVTLAEGIVIFPLECSVAKRLESVSKLLYDIIYERYLEK